MFTCQTCMTSFNVVNTFFANLAVYIRTPSLTKMAVVLTDLGSPQNVVMYCLVIIMLLWLHGKTAHLTQFVITMSTGALIVFLTKTVVQLPRPFDGLISETGYSFASGHATMAMIFFMLIAYSYKLHIKNLTLRRLFVTANILLAVLIGATRVYLGVHYATDVIGGLLIGLIVSGVSIIMFERHHRMKVIS